MANQFDTILGPTIGNLKIFYEGPIISQFNDEIPFWREIEKGNEKYNGLQVNRPIKVRRNPGVGATTDGGPLPKIGTQTTTQAVISAKFNYLRFGVSGPMIKASQGDKGAFVGIVEYEMTEGLNDIKTNVNRQFFWNGDGKIAEVAANAVASTVITANGRSTGEDGNKYLDVGLLIDIYSGTTPVATGVQINAISGTSTVTLTLSAAVTVAAGNTIVLSNSFQNEINGLRTSLDGLTTTIYNIDRSQYQVYQGNLINCSGNQLNLDFIQQGWNAGKYRGGAKYSYVTSDFNTERMYNKLLVADKRFVGRVVGDGTFSYKDETYLEYGGIKWISDKDCTQDIYIIDSKKFKKYILGSELQWVDDTGAYLIAQPEADLFEVRLRHFTNMFPEKPSAEVRVTNYISP